MSTENLNIGEGLELLKHLAKGARTVADRFVTFLETGDLLSENEREETKTEPKHEKTAEAPKPPRFGARDTVYKCKTCQKHSKTTFRLPLWYVTANGIRTYSCDEHLAETCRHMLDDNRELPATALIVQPYQPPIMTNS